MKAYFLKEQNNISLQNKLRKSCTEIDYDLFVNDIVFKLNVNFDKHYELRNNLFFIINKIFLDNIFKHVAYKSVDNIMHLINNKNFSKDMYINTFYISQLLDILFIYEEDACEIENFINKSLYSYIDKIYLDNVDEINKTILDIFEDMYNNFGSCNVNYYKFELYNNYKPILFLVH